METFKSEIDAIAREALQAATKQEVIRIIMERTAMPIAALTGTLLGMIKSLPPEMANQCLDDLYRLIEDPDQLAPIARALLSQYLTGR